MKNHYGVLLVLMILSTAVQSQSLFNQRPLTGLNKARLSQITISDLNNDAQPDLVALEKGADGYSFVTYRNDSLNFVKVSNNLPIADSIWFAVADMNNDNEVDIVTVHQSKTKAPVLEVFFKDSLFGFRSYVEFPLSNFTSGLVEDFDNDGRKDLFICNGGKTGSILRQSQGSYIKVPTNIPYNDHHRYEVIDYDKNGRLDIVALGVNVNDTLGLGIYLNNHLNFKRIFYKTEIELFTATTTGDYDSDGNHDIFMSGKNSLGEIQHGIMHFPEGKYVKLSTLPDFTDNAILADFDGDGATDIFSWGYKGQKEFQAGIYSQKFNKFTSILSQAMASAACAYGDMNQDGNLDLLMHSGNDSIVNSLFINTSTPNQGPIFPISKPIVAIGADNLYFMHWPEAADKVTPSAGITYDVFLGPNIKLPKGNSPETDLTNGNRKLTRYGKINSNVVYFENLQSTEISVYGIIPVDNALHTNRYTSLDGACTGKLSYGTSNVRYLDSTYCRKKMLTLASPSGEPVLWYTSSGGILGIDTLLNYQIQGEDKLYALQINQQLSAYSYVFSIHVKTKKIDLGNDTALCKNNVSRISIATDSSLITDWYINGVHDTVINESKIISSKSDTITVIASNKQCNDADTVTIFLKPLPQVNMTHEKTIEGTSLTASGAFRYYWEGTGILTDRENNQVYVDNRVQRLFSVTAFTDFGCSQTFTTLIVSDSSNNMGDNGIYIPGLFSPNGDGNNELFQVYGLKILRLSLNIMDRNGTLLYVIDSVGDGWNGEYKGKPMDEGLYYWSLAGEFTDHSPISDYAHSHGTFKLVR